MVDEIVRMLEENSDLEQAEKMSAYMQNKFKFAGIPKPKLKELIKPYIKDMAKKSLDWNLVFGLWKCELREAQYVALEYLQKHRKQLCPSDIDKLKMLITEKSWWETVDTIDAFVGDLVLQDNRLIDTMLQWAVSDNIWLRRVAIDYQQKYKDKTNEDILERIIVSNLGSDEFFINKAIGWSLRDYSKVKPEWVVRFLEKYGEQMDALSRKEASKYLG
ncbi:MAG: DNA alkylation repair protein [Eubacteriales bacterium]|nr:DNA alkylation repair protein [Eubacteriales bacterium]